MKGKEIKGKGKKWKEHERKGKELEDNERKGKEMKAINVSSAEGTVKGLNLNKAKAFQPKGNLKEL